jgi:hypothetical protein
MTDFHAESAGRRGQQYHPSQDRASWESGRREYDMYHAPKTINEPIHISPDAGAGMIYLFIGIAGLFLVVVLAPFWIPYLIYKHLENKNIETADKFARWVIAIYLSSLIGFFLIALVSEYIRKYKIFIANKDREQQQLIWSDNNDKLQPILQEISKIENISKITKKDIEKNIKDDSCIQAELRDTLKYGSVMPLTYRKYKRCSFSKFNEFMTINIDKEVTYNNYKVLIRHNVEIIPISPYNSFSGIEKHVTNAQRYSEKCSIVQFTTRATIENNYSYVTDKANVYTSCSLKR